MKKNIQQRLRCFAVFAVTALVFALAFAACGDESSGDNTGSAPGLDGKWVWEETTGGITDYSRITITGNNWESDSSDSTDPAWKKGTKGTLSVSGSTITFALTYYFDPSSSTWIELTSTSTAALTADRQSFGISDGAGGTITYIKQ